MLRFNKLLIIAAISIPLFLPASLAAQTYPKMRIVSLTPATTEILFALGLGDEVVGVSTYCTWPADAKKKEKVGSFSNPNIEKIILLKPDLVILAGMEQKYLKTILSDLNIDYIIVEPSSLDGLTRSIKDIGDITGKRKQARALIKGIDDMIYKIRSKVSRISEAQRPKVYVEIWHDPIMSIGKSSFISDMVEQAGGVNITEDLKRSYSKIDPEEVVYRDPDIIVLTYMKPGSWIDKEFKHRIGWENIAAVRNKRVFADIEPDIILRPGPRVKEGLQELHKRIYGK